MYLIAQVCEGCGLPHPHPFLGSSGGVCAVLSQEGGEDDPDGCQEGPQKANTGGGHSGQGIAACIDWLYIML